MAAVRERAMEWLLESDEPAIRYRARTWLLGADEHDASVERDRARVADGAIVATLLEAGDPRTTPYRKWSGLHWRLVSLADFGLPADQPAVRAARRGR